MKNLTEKELVDIYGGNPTDTYNAFHDAGKAVHDAVVSAYNAVVDWWNS